MLDDTGSLVWESVLANFLVTPTEGLLIGSDNSVYLCGSYDGPLSGIPDDALLSDVAESAAGKHLHILSNGHRTVLSPIVLAGWTEIHVRVKSATRAALVPQPLHQEALHAAA